MSVLTTGTGGLLLAVLSGLAPAAAQEGAAEDLLVDQPPEQILRAAEAGHEGRALAVLPDRDQVHATIDQGLEFLLAAQNLDGSWGGWGKPAHEFWSNPHTHFSWTVATTGLCVQTLLEQPPSEALVDATDRALDYMLDQAPLKRPSDWDVDNTWGCLYGVAALSGVLAHPRYAGSDRAEPLREKIQEYIGLLAGLQSPDGGWGYYDFDTKTRRPSWSTSFMSGVGVLALLDAQAVGIELPEGMLKAAVRAVERCLLPTGAYTYSVMAIPTPGGEDRINRMQGSLSRVQVCNLALVRAGSAKIDHDDLLAGLDAFFEHHRFLDVARKKPYPHEAYYQNSGYFYFFGHYYAAQVLELLDPPEQARYGARLAREVVKTQETDGSMWDFYINTYHKPYGTAFGVMTLTRTLPRESLVSRPPR